MKTIQADIPDNLYKGAVALVKDGWFRDEKEIYSEAIRRFLEAHQADLLERFIREDIDWGISGND